MPDQHTEQIKEAFLFIESLTEESARRRLGGVSVEMERGLSAFEKLAQTTSSKLMRQVCLGGFIEDTAQMAKTELTNLKKAWEELPWTRTPSSQSRASP